MAKVFREGAMILQDGKEIQDLMAVYLRKKYGGVLAPYWSPGKMIKTAYNFEQAEKQFKQMRRFVHVQRKARILDVGCGFGHFVSYCLGQGYDCWGCEVDAKLINIARKILSTNGQDYRRIKLSSGNRLPFKDDTLDVINLHYVLDYAPDIPGLLSELKRILAPNGKIFLIMPNYACCYSPVYMMVFFPWLPMGLNRLYFRLMKRPNTKFLESLTFTNPNYCQKAFDRLGFSVENIGLDFWNSFFSGKESLEGRSRFLRLIVGRKGLFNLAPLAKLLGKLGFYTPLIYVLEDADKNE